MMNSVWLVVGTSGSYETREEWAVAAYPEREQAELHAAKANEAAVPYFSTNLGRPIKPFALDPHEAWWGQYVIPARTASYPFDRHMEANKGGITGGFNYEVREVPFFLYVDQYLEAGA